MIPPTYRRSQRHDRTACLTSRRPTPSLRPTTVVFLVPTPVDELCFPRIQLQFTDNVMLGDACAT